MVDPRSPCIIGVAQRTWHPDGHHAPEPLEMWAQVADEVARDAGRPGALATIDALHLVHCMSWNYDDPATRLCARIGITPAHTEVSVLAGTASQRMVNAAAERMLAGSSELALVVGAEALGTRRRMRQADLDPSWSHEGPSGGPPIDLDEWFWPTEWAHDVVQPSLTFAALDTARRARLGIDPEDYRMHEARVLARFTDVASTNPHAWFRSRRSAEEIATVTTDNRMISTPYTKYMTAIMDVDMAAGLLIATHGKADELGIPADRRVYLRGWSFGRDATHVAERPFLDRSPAMRHVSAAALASAGTHVDDIAHLDLYSCFASSVLYATDALALEADDPRGFTVTGGLPFHGGPSSNYTAHAIAELVQRLRSDGSGFGLVSGVGMHMTKHVYAVYSPEPGPVRPPDYRSVQDRIDRDPLRPVVGSLVRESPATIGCYSVTHDRSGAPTTALIVADTADGSRAYARTTRPDDLAALGEGEWVGRSIDLFPGPDGSNEFALSIRDRPREGARASP